MVITKPPPPPPSSATLIRCGRCLLPSAKPLTDWGSVSQFIPPTTLVRKIRQTTKWRLPRNAHFMSEKWTFFIDVTVNFDLWSWPSKLTWIWSLTWRWTSMVVMRCVWWMLVCLSVSGRADWDGLLTPDVVTCRRLVFVVLFVNCRALHWVACVRFFISTPYAVYSSWSQCCISSVFTSAIGGGRCCFDNFCMYFVYHCILHVVLL